MSTHTSEAAAPQELESSIRIRAHRQFFRRTLESFQEPDADFQPHPAMLSVVGHPAAVNPDRRLSLLARAYSWPTFRLSDARASA